MALRTKEIDLEAEQNRLRDEMEEVAEKLVEWQDDPQKAQGYMEAGEELRSQINALEWAREQWDVDSVTLAELSEGERTRVDHFVDDHEGIAERVPFVAVGTHDAPYLEHDPENVTEEDFKETVQTLVDDVRIPFITWAESKIGSLSGLDEGNSNEFTELVQAKQAEASQSESGETTAERSPSATDTAPE